MNYFFELAAVTARMSRDPNTQVGAVIVRPDKTIASLGFNGFARGVSDDPKLYTDRETKLRRVVHAEMNAILTAREPLHGYTLYVRPLPPCPHCAGAIIQSGIKKIVWSGPEVPERWAEDMAEAMKMFTEAGVEVERVEVARVTAPPAAAAALLEAMALQERKIAYLKNALAAAERHDCRKMSAMGVGGGAGQLFGYGDYDSIRAARDIVIAAENLAKRVSELQKRRDELQAHNSELHARIIGLRRRVDAAERVRIVVQPGSVKMGGPPAPPCRIIISGDHTRCETCGTEWDTNDSFPPPCPRRGAKP
jgi:dCMP deaminase